MTDQLTSDPTGTGGPVGPGGPRPVGSEVPAAFDDVASTYDLMVGLSPGYHDQLRASADALLDAVLRARAAGAAEPTGPLRLVDLGCGSGASTAALEQAVLARGLQAEILGVDGSAGMLREARGKTWRLPVEFVQLDGETLDAADLGAPVDGILAAYLFRNVTGRDRLLGRLHEALAPGGALAVHEYAVRGDRRARLVWDAVCWGVIIPLGLVTAPRSSIYRYLWRSVLDFDSVVGFRDRMTRQGYDGVRSRTFGGLQPWVLHTFVGLRR